MEACAPASDLPEISTQSPHMLGYDTCLRLLSRNQLSNETRKIFGRRKQNKETGAEISGLASPPSPSILLQVVAILAATSLKAYPLS